MIRSLLMALAVFTITSPAFAGEFSGSILVKGGKSYQTRQIESGVSKIQDVEPAAGGDVAVDDLSGSKNISVSDTVSGKAGDNVEGKKIIKLHGKK